MPDNQFEIHKYQFNKALSSEIENLNDVKNYWPLVYILSNGKIKEAYIGETTDAQARMSSHLKHINKSKLTAVHLITSKKFNKSATLDIESNLIKYFSADGQYELMNANIGIANHNYYQKEELYEGVFYSIWNKLRSEGVVKHSLEYINNSDLFKYSPYKNLTREQINGLETIIDNLLDVNFKDIIVEGGAGTGKTILAIFLFKLLNTDNKDFNFNEFGDEEDVFIEKVRLLKLTYPNPKMALVVPMSSFRDTLKKVFRSIKGLSAKMVVGPSEVSKLKDEDFYDIILVDESHRLRRRVNLGAYFGAFDKAAIRLDMDKMICSELDWVLKKSKKSLLFYDENQSIKPSDTKKDDFDKLKANPSTNIIKLKSQFRVKGGNGYVDYIKELLNCSLKADEKYSSKDYEFLLFSSLEDMISKIKEKNDKHRLSRLVAGYSWPWISNKDKTKFDINIDGISLKWNGTSKDWINSEGAIDEVGCIHTTQGYDLNYTGLIFGNEISYDKANNEIVINSEEYYDKNGKQSIKCPLELKSFIINIYKTIMLRGIKGTYLYICDDNLREYFSKHIEMFEKENQKEKIILLDEEINNSIPYYDLKVAAGNFSEDQIASANKWLELPEDISYSNDYFACKVFGESMNKVIPNGSICLFKKYYGGSRNGEIVLVESSSIQDPDFGSGYTVKEYLSTKVSVSSDEWRHKAIQLKPLSKDSSFKNIEIFDDELSSFKVIGKFVSVLSS